MTDGSPGLGCTHTVRRLIANIGIPVARYNHTVEMRNPEHYCKTCIQIVAIDALQIKNPVVDAAPSLSAVHLC
jgi:hypothetical protein